VKIDKRKGKPSQARLEHLARIREKAAETRRKKADEKNKKKRIQHRNKFNNQYIIIILHQNKYHSQSIML
jgi:hypothetical protein